jgi:hypothetical protein
VQKWDSPFLSFSSEGPAVHNKELPCRAFAKQLLIAKKKLFLFSYFSGVCWSRLFGFFARNLLLRQEWIVDSGFPLKSMSSTTCRWSTWPG